MTPVTFSSFGPFDGEERTLVHDVMAALIDDASPEVRAHAARVTAAVARLDRLGGVLADFPSLFSTQALGPRRRDIKSLLRVLEGVELSNIDMFLPTRATLSRCLVMGEMNFYRMLRHVCGEAFAPSVAAPLLARVEQKLCLCIYTRLAEDLLINIASDNSVSQRQRHRGVLALAQLWERADYRLSDFFPVLEATWDARRRVRATLGTLMGTAEMFRLMQEGCDPRFVDYLERADCTDDEAAAFREFLFGMFSEQLRELEEQLRRGDKRLINIDDLGESMCCRDAARKGDPALAMFDFFRSRHLQALARRQAQLPGPKRTAEEYVMIDYLDTGVDWVALSQAPS